MVSINLSNKQRYFLAQTLIPEFYPHNRYKVLIHDILSVNFYNDYQQDALRRLVNEYRAYICPNDPKLGSQVFHGDYRIIGTRVDGNIHTIWTDINKEGKPGIDSYNLKEVVKYLDIKNNNLSKHTL